MRIKGHIDNIEPYGPGKVDILIDNIEDLWALYNLLSRGDYIKTVMFRKIQHETGNKITSTKKKLVITIRIEEIDYNQIDGLIRIKGKNVSVNDNIAIGQFQTTEIGKGDNFSLFKKCWDEIQLETLKAASDAKTTSDVAAIIMEEGVAHLYLITNSITTLGGKITQTIPKKRSGSNAHDKAKKEFFHKILEQLVKNISFTTVKCAIIASPGFTKDEFGDYMHDAIEGNVKSYETIKANMNKFIYVHSSSGYKQSLDEVLTKPDIKLLIKNTKASDDTIVMDRFNEMLSKEMDKVFFGMAGFEIAAEKLAIDTLIITDNFYRKLSPFIRRKIGQTIKAIKLNGGKVVKMSSQHSTGEKIDAFGGIVGILTYVVSEINDLGDEVLEIVDNNEVEEDTKEEEDFALKLMMNNMSLRKTSKEGTTEDNNNNDDDFEGEEDDKEDMPIENEKKKEKEKEKGTKKTKEAIKAKDINRKTNQRKRSSYEQEGDDY